MFSVSYICAVLEAFEEYISNNQLCNKKEKILIAVSGGIDSVVLLDLFYKAGYSLSIAHCNFKLRNEESNGDEEFVKKLAGKYKVECYSKSCDTISYAEKYGYSIQEAARELRYQWFEEICRNNGYHKIAVAQHADDQVETFFINLLRGSGLAGLKGMPVKRRNIIRPLLFTNRNNIEFYADDNGLEFREDTSNQSNKYLRNRIRHDLIPQLGNIQTGYKEAIVRSLGYLKEDFQLLRGFMDSKKEELLIHEENSFKIPIDTLINQKNHGILLYYILKDFGFSRDQTDSIINSINDKRTGKLFVSKDYQLLVDRDSLILKENSATIEKNEFLLQQAGDQVEKPFLLRSKVLKNIDIEHIVKNSSIAYFDLEKLKFPLIIRKWKAGDRFVPFGMKGSKLISDFLIDLKTDRFEKENVYVLESDGRITWVIGYRISDNYKITDKTKSILSVQKMIS